MKYTPLLFALVLAACAPEPADDDNVSDPVVTVDIPPLETHADSLAMRSFDAVGGPEAWSRVRYLKFDFGREAGIEKTVFRTHLWDRATGDYRLEWDQDEDRIVVVFNVNTREGTAAANGEVLATDTQEDLLARAYRAYINDTYWLLAPIKLLDEGVTRTLVPDSATVEQEVIKLTYDGVGLTPGDQFWFWLNRTTGQLQTWGYVLEGREKAPITKWDWLGFRPYEVGDVTVRLSDRKTDMVGTTHLMTDNISLPETVDERAFSSFEPLFMDTAAR
ncbi:MAG: hypothetical protein COV99_10835 [Bacteroidetes bacterium CG12_big_fil_rev_8_21_14_0_65_60_17]|nr:MAG: hypothetical protein COV99_10835 [Bacteroidetes bacterium CG12_big_fil_rev_8_21_14_0_65_60_17]